MTGAPSPLIADAELEVSMAKPRRSICIICTLALSAAWFSAAAQEHGSPPSEDVSRLVASLLGNTPFEEDLAALTDRFGGRPTGSEQNLDAVEWALERFAAAGVDATKEPFTVPELWLARSASATIEGDGIRFEVPVAAMPFSVATPQEGVTAPLVDAGFATDDELEQLGERARGSFLLVETVPLTDIDGLFREYIEASRIEAWAFAAGAAGVVYMGARPSGVLHRHNASLGPDNEHPLAILEREAASRALRLLRAGHRLDLQLRIDVDSGPAYTSWNVIGEIKGTAMPEEIVVIGAHIDSWELGTGALDNACNVAMVLDIARQMARLDLQPKRTIRFALWNGEEQGLYGSWEYTKSHADELDRHVMASSYDTGTGRIIGLYTGGNPDVLHATERALAPIAGLGPFTNVDLPSFGTDHFDFLLQGVANLVANQAPANYGPNYHAASDTFDKVDLDTMRINGAIAAAVTWQFANMDVTWHRQTREEIEALIDGTDFGEELRAFHVLEDWENGRRGRPPE
jgi:hypothetical protein